MSSRSVTPTWLPPTLAMALWQQGGKDEAVAWYAAAVRTEPARFRDSSQHAQALPNWTDGKRAIRAGVQAAWARSPPDWP